MEKVSRQAPDRRHPALLRARTIGLALALSLPGSASAEDADFAVIGYLPSYRMANVSAERLAQVTDVIYFGLEPPVDGRLPALPIESSVLRKLHAIKRANNCRLLLCVGGWQRSRAFPVLAQDDAARRRYIAGLLAYCRDNRFDGVDFDWEHPEGEAELAAYARLLSQTRASFDESDLNLQLTVAQAAWQNLGKRAYKAVHRVHLMSYDHDFPQATMEKSQADVDRLIQWGCPTNKIALGLPFYGRNRQGATRSYTQLLARGHFDRATDNIDGYALNGPATIAAKVRFARKRGLGGVMVWELGQDARREDMSLLSTIGRELQRK